MSSETVRFSDGGLGVEIPAYMSADADRPTTTASGEVGFLCTVDTTA